MPREPSQTEPRKSYPRHTKPKVAMRKLKYISINHCNKKYPTIMILSFFFVKTRMNNNSGHLVVACASA